MNSTTDMITALTHSLYTKYCLDLSWDSIAIVLIVVCNSRSLMG